jgi:hypothetical protein
MSRSIASLTLVAALGLIAGCAQQAPQSVDDAWGEFRSSYRELESAEEKTALAEDFLTTHPGSEYSDSLAGIVAYYRGHKMGDYQGAFQIVDTTLAEVDDPETRFNVQLELYDLAQELGRPMDLAQVAIELAQHRSLSFSENLEVVELAAEHQEWEVSHQHAIKALELATPAAYRADYPDEDFSDEEVVAKADRRKVLALAYQGWAMANTERESEALGVFESAAELSTLNYLGVPDSPLYRFWGQTALALEDYDTALDLLGPDAVLGDSEEAFDAYRAAFAGKHGSEDGFDDSLWSERERLAKPVDDFTLADYDGNQVQLATLKQDKVVLLSFWFPT